MKHIIALFALITIAATAAELPNAKESLAMSPRYQAKEITLSLYGTAYSRNLHADPQLGAGIGADYWFTRGFGAGLRIEDNDLNKQLLGKVTGRVSVRAPLWDKLAPYGYADGGWNFERDTALFGVGGGLEYRTSHRVGLFVEAGPEVEVNGGKDVFGAAGLRAAAGVRVKF